MRRDYSSNSVIFGKNVVRYLLINLREKSLIDVMPNRFTKMLAGSPLYLASGCRPFERNPLLANLPHSKTAEVSITKTLSASGTEKINILLPYLRIRNAINKSGELYFKASEIASDKSINDYNEYLVEWEQDQGYSIVNDSGLVTISAYETITLKILQRLLDFTQAGIKGQKELNARFIKDHSALFDKVDVSKQKAIKYAFVNSRILLIYGAAGTGKTTLINYISSLMPKSKKLFLTKTHAAIQHLQRRINNPGSDSDFICIDSFTRRVNLPDYDIIFVDECSTIDNRTMLNFISKISSDSLIVLAGDINQIESIDFGNWFYYAKDIITTQGANIELLDTWRTQEENLLSLWEEVRNNDVRITEKLVIDGPFSKEIGSDIFTSDVKDEVVLCLNYDGKFGLNNINSYFQNANPNGEAIIWQSWRFKKGDKILFNDNSRFTYLYNNLKGIITDIEKTDDQIAFTIDVETIITEQQCKSDQIEYIDTIGERTRIKLIVYAFDEDEIENEEDAKKTIIPFQLAYAVSIHKAQGLEYDSVKVIIPSVNSEKITKGVFYTAITRTKKKLTIYWSSETMEAIISGFSSEHNGFKSLEIIKNKLVQTTSSS
ncbi:MAG: ATP-dependent RecD-like DNA helicase [Oscillospiraceae bacterium]